MFSTIKLYNFTSCDSPHKICLFSLRVILWTEITSSGQGTIMAADTDTADVKTVFGNETHRTKRSNKDKCSCRTSYDVHASIAMTYKRPEGRN